MAAATGNGDPECVEVIEPGGYILHDVFPSDDSGDWQ